MSVSEGYWGRGYVFVPFLYENSLGIALNKRKII